jgi:hypothetical protein
MIDKQRDHRLRHLRIQMLRQRGFRYLRYAHMRDFIQNVDSIKTVGVIGAGHGFAELTVAIEYPDIEFMLTDIVIPGRPNYWRCMDLCMRWGVRNVRFGVWDVLTDPPAKFDVVMSTEVLEHIENADLALLNKKRAAKKAVYALTPHATDVENNNIEKRKRAFDMHEHFVCGYNRSYFKNADENVQLCGAYWADKGLLFRQKLQTLSPEQIEADYANLIELAKSDIVRAAPETAHCLGVKAIMLL